MAKKRALIVLRDVTMIQMASDAIRMEILRLLSARPRTQTDLSALLGITTSSVHYHLKLLLNAGMIRLGHTIVEEHGLVQTFYGTATVHFVVDREGAPTATRKSFLHSYMERLRGIIGWIQMVDRKMCPKILITSDTMEELSEELAKSTVTVGEHYYEDLTELDRETYLTSFYGEVLLQLLHHEKWRALPEETSSLGAFIKSELESKNEAHANANRQLAGVKNH